MPRSIPIDAKAKERHRPIINGHHPSPQARTPKDLKISLEATKSQQAHGLQEQVKHPLPPRPQSPARGNPEQKKRPLESGETNPEKRAKVGHVESRTPLSLQQKETPRKSGVTVAESKPSPAKPQKPAAAAASPLPKKATGTKSIDTKAQTSKPKSEKPLDLPPLLSPLPADFEPSPDPHAAIKKSDPDKITPHKTPQVKNGLASDTIVVKQPHVKSHALISSPLPDPPTSSSPPFVLPRLLSPGLPAVVEEELLRLQQKSATLNTVEARHEKARLPDAPGVARKTPRNAKVGHPPKRTPVEPKPQIASENEVKKTLIVRIPYKKRNAIHIQRILALTQKPRGKAGRPETGERLARGSSTSAAPREDDSASEEDVPLSRSRATKVASSAPSTYKKRPNDSTNRSEPAPKRPKLPDVDISKASTPVTPAFKSPAVSNPSASAQKSLLATPKKGDAMKSVAMRRIDSGEGLARTPQTTSTSTPASAEKLRSNGAEARPNPELEKQKAAEAKLFPLGTMLKRKMDSLLSPKNRDPSVTIPEPERKVGLCIGVESLMAYMLAFQARDRIAQLRAVTPDASTWESFVKLQAFLVHGTKPYIELFALVEQMGAVAREIWNRALVEHLALVKDGGKIEKLGKEIRDNSRAKDATWSSVKRNEKVLKGLGVKSQILGPWSGVQDAVTLAGTTLAAYCSRENLEWSPDAQLAVWLGI